ncbi:MAG: DUF1488 family protein [Gammaproteobacteria bacterium]
MSRERPANTKQTAKQASPMSIKGGLKTTNATNPVLHKDTAANLSTKTQGGKGSVTTGGKGSVTTGGKGTGTTGGQGFVKGQKQGTQGITTGRTGTGTGVGSGSTSSISLGQIRFDSNTHMLYADATKGGSQIRCSITQDALCECFDAEPTSSELQSCFTQHKGEILKALEQKWTAGKWKTPNKEICLEEGDLRKFIE